METNKRAHPSDFGIPEEHWQAAADYAGMVIFQGEESWHEFNVGGFVERTAEIIGGRPFPTGRNLHKGREIADLALTMLAAAPVAVDVDEASVERLARFLAEEACAGSCMEVPPERWRGHVGDARDMLRAAAGLDKAGSEEASPVRVLATPVACNVGDER